MILDAIENITAQDVEDTRTAFLHHMTNEFHNFEIIQISKPFYLIYTFPQVPPDVHVDWDSAMAWLQTYDHVCIPCVCIDYLTTNKNTNKYVSYGSTRVAMAVGKMRKAYADVTHESILAFWASSEWRRANPKEIIEHRVKLKLLSEQNN